MGDVRTRGGWMPLLVYPIVSGVVLAAAFPPLPLGFLAYVGLIPLFLSAEQLKGRAAFGAGFLQGLVFYGATIYWISWVTPPGMAGAVLYMSLFRGLCVWALSLAVVRFGLLGLWSAPLIWVGFEYFNTLGDMGFPWVVLGNSQTHYLPLIQYADATGVYGVSFWIVVVNLTVLALYRGRVRWPVWAGALAALFGAPALYGVLALRQPPAAKTVTVGVVQPNISPVAKEYGDFWENLAILKPLTVRAASEGAKLVVWPETAAAFYVNSPSYQNYQYGIQAMVDSLGVELFSGAYRLEMASPPRIYNSSFLFAPHRGTLGYYDKIHLVPFGERAPFPNLFPFLRKIQFTGGGYVGGNWDSGDTLTVFHGPGARFSALICFDSVFPDLARKLVSRGAEFLVVITDDGWFGRTSSAYQHVDAAVFRAVENRRAVVQCADTGISSLIGPYGRKSQTTGLFHPAVLVGKVPVRTDLTFYTRHGDVFSQFCLVLTVFVLLGALLRGRGKGKEEEPEEPSILPRPAAGNVPTGPLEGEEPPEEGGGQAMPFLDHLEELRWRILKGLGAVAVGAVLCGIFSDEILGLLYRPVHNMNPRPVLIILKPIGMFVVKLNIALVGGAVLALPVVLYQLWLFVAPGLFENERRYVTFIILSSTVCFALGATVAYLGVIPVALKFLVGLTSGTGVQAQFDIGEYIGFVLKLLVAFGVVFELPVATFFLSKVGLVTAERMRKGRRYAIVITFILGAVLTPPDVMSQMMLAFPLMALYEISIWVAKLARR